MKTSSKKKAGMTSQQCMDTIRLLSYKHSYHGKLYAHLKTLEKEQPEEYESIMRQYEEQAFQDPVDFMIYVEGSS